LVKKYLFALTLSISSIGAIELKYGVGGLEWDMGLFGVQRSPVDINNQVTTISNEHQAIGETPLYYFANLDIYRSSSLEMEHKLADTLDEYFPDIVDTITQPNTSNFSMKGYDIEGGIGYDLIVGEKGYLGLGITGGISTPTLKMNNALSLTDQESSILRETNTNLNLYRYGLSLHFGYSINTEFSFYLKSIYAEQKGDLTNKLVNDSLDVSGIYSNFDLGFQYYLFSFITEEPNIYIKGGYAHKSWDIDTVKSTYEGENAPSIIELFKPSITNDVVYLGIGVKL